MLLLSARSEFGVTDKCCYARCECKGKLLHGRERWVLHAALKLADEGTVDLGAKGEFLLREAERLALGAQGRAEGFEERMGRGSACHPCKGRVL